MTDCGFSGCLWGAGHEGPHSVACGDCAGAGFDDGRCERCLGWGRVDLTADGVIAPGPPIAMCRLCGCTDARACEGGCWWVEVDLCSGCLEVDLRRRVAAATARELWDWAWHGARRGYSRPQALPARMWAAAHEALRARDLADDFAVWPPWSPHPEFDQRTAPLHLAIRVRAIHRAEARQRRPEASFSRARRYLQRVDRALAHRAWRPKLLPSRLP